MRKSFLLCSAGLLVGTTAFAQGDDNCVTAQAIGGEGVFAYDGTGATDSGGPTCDGNEGFDVFFEWTAGADGTYVIDTCAFGVGGEDDTVLAVYNDCAELALGTCIVSDDDTCLNENGNTWMSEVSLPGVLSGDTFIIQVTDWDGDGIALPGDDPLGFGDMTITNLGSVLPPDNDTCATATVIANAGTFAFDNANATTTGPAICDGSEGAEVWFSWTAPCDADYTFSTCGATGDSVLNLYDDCTVAACVASNDDAACGLQSEVFLPGVLAGTTYIIEVAGWNGNAVAGDLTITSSAAPVNDECANAIAIVGTGILFPFDNTCSSDSANPGSALCDASSVGAGPSDIPSDVWFVWTATSSGPYSLSTCNISPVADTKIAVYDGSDCSASLIVDCDDDTPGCGNFSSEVFFDAVAGDDYLIRIGAWAGNGGTDTGAGEFIINKETGNYCSTGANGAIMGFTGTAAVGSIDFELNAAPVPDTFGIFYFGMNQTSQAFGGGFRCIGNPGIFRLPPDQAAGNVATELIDFSSGNATNIMAGQNWNFQYWFRDNSLPSGFDLSDGLRVPF